MTQTKEIKVKDMRGTKDCPNLFANIITTRTNGKHTSSDTYSYNREEAEIVMNGLQKLLKMNICKHCGTDINIRNYPSGHCDHLHYPDYCNVCKKNENK